MYVLDGPVCDGSVLRTALEKVWPRSLDTAIRIFVVSLLNTDHIAYTWSWYRWPGIALTAIHCLSSTCPSCFGDEFGDSSRSRPPLPLTQCSPMSSEYETSMAPFGCSFVLSKKELNGSVVWYTRPWVSNATFGSVFWVQLGGMSWVPVDTQSYPCTWLFATGVPFWIV